VIEQFKKRGIMDKKGFNVEIEKSLFPKENKV